MDQGIGSGTDLVPSHLQLLQLQHLKVAGIAVMAGWSSAKATQRVRNECQQLQQLLVPWQQCWQLCLLEQLVMVMVLLLLLSDLH